MNFFNKNVRKELANVNQSRRFSLVQYIAAVSALLLSVTALTYAAGILTLNVFKDGDAISSKSVNDNFDYVQANLNVISASMVSATSSITNINSTLNTIKLSNSIPTTSGTAIDFTNIPAGVKRIKLAFVGVGLSGSADFLIQIGSSTGVESAGYNTLSTANGFGRNSSTGIVVANSNPNAAWYGILYLDLADVITNTWIVSGTEQTTDVGPFIAYQSGFKSISGVLNNLRLTTTNGSNTFTKGKVSIAWEF